MDSWVVTPIPGKGDCLFAAAADQLYNDPGRQADVRDLAFREMTDKQGAYADFFTDTGYAESVAAAQAAYDTAAAVGAAAATDEERQAAGEQLSLLQVELDAAKEKETLESHLAHLNTAGFWGSQPDIKAISDATGLPIEVYTKTGETYTLKPGTAAAPGVRTPIRLLWNGINHYDSIRDPAIRYPLLPPPLPLSPPLSPLPDDDDLALVTSLLLTSGALALTAPPEFSALGLFKNKVKLLRNSATKAAKGIDLSGGKDLLLGLASGIKGAFSKPASTGPPRERRPDRERSYAAREPVDISDNTLLPGSQSDLKYLFERRKEPAVQESVKKVEEPIKPGDSIEIYVMWGDKLLIYRRPEGAVYVPNGSTVQEDTSFAAAALRILQATAKMAKPLTEQDLHVFKKEKVGDKTSVSYYVTYAYKPEVTGSDNITDIDTTFTFRGVMPPDPAIPNDVSMNFVFKGEPAGSAKGYFWADLVPLRVLLLDKKLAVYRDPMLEESLRALAFKLRIKTGKEELDLRKLPAWSAEQFDPSKISAACKSSPMRCLDKTVRDDIYTADEFARDGRLVKRIEDPQLIEYQRLINLRDETDDPNKRGQIQAKIARKYHNHYVHIRDPHTKIIQKRLVPNPYVALSYREDTATTFATPDGVSKYDKPYGTMKQQNFQLLQDLVPKQIIADKSMAIAILESLWYCGQNPMISDDPRCFPMRLLGELKEYEADKIQRSQAVEAKAVIEYSEWPTLKLMLAYLKQSVMGAKTYEFNQDIFPPLLLGKKVQPIPAPPLSSTIVPVKSAVAILPSPSPSPSPPIAAKPITLAIPAAVPTLETNVRIVPRRLGGIGIQQVLPGRALGVLPPFIRAR